MPQPSHLGVICVEVSEILKAQSRLKVQKRDNMVRFNSSYLITDPVSLGTPRATSSPRTPSHSQFFNSPNESIKRKLSPRRRRRHSPQKSKNINNNNYDSEETNNRVISSDGKNYKSNEDKIYNNKVTQKSLRLEGGGGGGEEREVMPPINSNKNTLITSIYPSSKIERHKTSNMKGGIHRLEDVNDINGSSFNAWNSNKRLSTSVSDIGSVKSQQNLADEGASHSSNLVEKANDVDIHKYQQQKESQTIESQSEMSESATRVLNSVMMSMQQRIWAKAHRLHESHTDISPLHYYHPNSDSDNASSSHESNNNNNSNIKKTPRDSPALSLPEKMIGPLGSTRVQPTPHPWELPLPPRLSTAQREARNRARAGIGRIGEKTIERNKIKPTFNSPSSSSSSKQRPHRLQDSNGIERVLLLGVVPTLPKPAKTSLAFTRATHGGPVVPPVFRRLGRTGLEPSNRPKRF